MDFVLSKSVALETPVRFQLPPGKYTVTLEGPNRERKQNAITVPPGQGTACFVEFKKADINQLMGHP
jgi:PEGA domain